MFGGSWFRKAMLGVWVAWCAGRNLCLEEGAGKRLSEYELHGVPDGICIWRKVPESDAGSMGCMVCRTEPVPRWQQFVVTPSGLINQFALQVHRTTSLDIQTRFDVKQHAVVHSQFSPMRLERSEPTESRK